MFLDNPWTFGKMSNELILIGIYHWKTTIMSFQRGWLDSVFNCYDIFVFRHCFLNFFRLLSALYILGTPQAKYDSDNKFPVWGFGAKYNNKVRHCFQCGTDVEVEGVQGIMDAYRGVFRTPLRMSFPTKFNEVIRTAAGYAQHEQVRLGI